MDWVKKNWILLVCGLVALAGIGIGSWALTGFKQVQAEADTIASIAGQLDGMRTGAANETMIIEAKKFFDRTNQGTNAALKSAKAINERAPLRDDVFPTEKKPDSGYQFRIAYRAEVQKLPDLINGGKAPSGAVIESVLHRMEDKLRKEANLTGAGGELRVPKPPQVPPWVPPTPAAARPAGEDRGSGGGPPDFRGGGGAPVDYRGGGGAPADYRGGAPADFRGGPEAASPPGGFRPGATSLTPPSVTIPGPEQLRPDAKRIAVYQVAKSIWTYLNDDTFELHPIGMPESVDRPTIEDLWAAQVFLWVEQDFVQALRRANEQAAEALPEDQRWVANLPVKHLTLLRISDYVAGAGSEANRQTSTAVLHRGGSLSYSGSARFGQSGVSFTERARTGEYDVVHVLLNLVVDARDLPKVLQELCKQNLVTPIQVQYRAVDAAAAATAGYLYGAGPLLNVDIVCETLFFRSIYDPIMPQGVKDILDGKVVERGPMR